jgi:ribonuclease III
LGKGSHNNERLEYLGDAILSAVIADYLFSVYPNCKEGFLTQLRSKLVNRENLNRVAMNMGFDKLVRSHKNIIPTKKHIYGNALEALIGAMYLDQGYKKAKKFIIDRIISVHFDLDQLACQDNDFKSQIIQWGQKNRKEISFGSYELTESDKPEPVFVATIHIMEQLAGEGLVRPKNKPSSMLHARHFKIFLPDLSDCPSYFILYHKINNPLVLYVSYGSHALFSTFGCPT